MVLRGCVFATLLFLFLNVLLSRAEIMRRSSLLVFGLLVAAGTTGVRWLRDWLTTNSNGATLAARVQAADAPVLIVGGAGYIGSILCRKLLQAGDRVRVLDSLVYGNAAIRELLGDPNFELIEGDCRDIRNVVKAMKGVKSVVHLAAIVGDPACEQDRQTALETNYAATRMIVEIAKGNGVERFVFASSCSVYGVTAFLMDENSAVKPVSLYGQTKVDSERALLEASGPDFHPTVLRLATVFGAGYRPRFDLVVNLLTAKAYHERVMTIFNGGQWRPFIHVADVAEGIMLMLSAPLPVVAGEVFNLGDSRLNFRLADIGEKIRVVFPDTVVQHVDNDDIRDYRVSFDKIRDMVGFQCRLTVDDGIQELKRCFDRGAIDDYKDALYNNQKFLQSATVAKLDEVQSKVMAAFGGL
jgi:nucleoside-diphosphate-sugar epimerase